MLSAGALTCRQTADCRNKSLTCKQGDKTLFTWDAFADHLAVSDKGQYIVGLSNRGVHPLFWLRNFSGDLIDLAPISAIHFCRESVTNVREWFDADRPDVTLMFEGGRLSNVIVRGCDGRDVLFNVGDRQSPEL
jgi:hypothetical protein